MKNVIKKIYYLPFYIQMQIWVRIPGENSDQWNKWQPTKHQSLSEFIEYELDVAPIPTNAITSRMWILAVLVTILTIIITQ